MKPKIRFKGFEGEWKAQSLSDHNFSIIAGGDVDKKLLQNNGKYPVIANALTNDGILGYYMDSFRVNGPAVTVTGRGDIGVAIARHYSFTPVVRLLSIKSNHNVDFLANAINCYKAAKESTGVPQLTTAKLQEYRIPIPKEMDEENAIASYFTSLDSQISASTSRLASLKQMKAASLQAMFPQEGETVPKIRFKGFEGEWKKVKLSEILTERHENSTITDSLPQLSFTIAEGVIRPEDRKSNKRDFLIKDIDNKRYLVTKVGDIIYNPANVVYGAIHRNSLMNGVVSPIYKIFTTMQDSNFIECAVRRPNFITKLAMCTEGTVTKLKSLKPEAFLNMELYITSSLEEQKLIGNYFTSLDRQISLQSQRLEKLKQIKSACLDKMFV